jgi:hypothetical protein
MLVHPANGFFDQTPNARCIGLIPQLPQNLPESLSYPTIWFLLFSRGGPYFGEISLCNEGAHRL